MTTTAPDARSAPTGLLERRFIAAADLARPEVRAAADETSPIGFKGRALAYGSRTTIGDPLRWGFFEEIEVGAAREAVAEDDIAFLMNHDPSLLLARCTAGEGTMRLTESSAGVDVDADMAPVSYARDLAVSLDRGDIRGMSFAFIVLEQRWETVEIEVQVDGQTQTISCDLRRLVKIGLRDVAVVTYPAYDETSAGLRSAATLAAYADHRGLDAAVRQALLEGRSPDAAGISEDTQHLTEAYQLRHRGLAALHGLSIPQP
jgi:HK97 family phage prohead protease